MWCQDERLVCGPWPPLDCGKQIALLQSKRTFQGTKDTSNIHNNVLTKAASWLKKIHQKEPIFICLQTKHGIRFQNSQNICTCLVKRPHDLIMLSNTILLWIKLNQSERVVATAVVGTHTFQPYGLSYSLITFALDCLGIQWLPQ